MLDPYMLGKETKCKLTERELWGMMYVLEWGTVYALTRVF